MTTTELIQIIVVETTLLTALALLCLYLLLRLLSTKSEREELKTDSLTEVLQRGVWEKEFKKRLKKRSQVVCIIDLDNLKEFNDTYGHIYGDKLIRLLASSLQFNLKDYDLIGRFGGDEFIVALDLRGVTDRKSQTSLIMERVRESFIHNARTFFADEPIEIEASYNFSYGYTDVARGRCELTEVYSAADKWLYNNK